MEVVGPKSAIARVTEAVTEPVSVAGARGTVNDGVTVGFLDSLVRMKTPRLAQVSVEVIPGPVERTIAGTARASQNIGDSLIARAVPNAVDVVLRGSREGVNRVDPDEVAAVGGPGRTRHGPLHAAGARGQPTARGRGAHSSQRQFR